MSARTDLVDALTAALPATYRVVGSPSCPDQIEVDTFAVRAWANQVTPALQSGAVQIALTVWVLTPLVTPGATDDVLDAAQLDVMGALYAMTWLTPPTAERGVMNDDTGPRWHGWRFETQAFGQIQEA